MNRLTISVCARSSATRAPTLLLTTLSRTLPNIRDPNTKVLLAIDADDTAMIDALNGTGLPEDPRIIISVKPREDSRGEKYDRALTEAPADIYLLAVDHAPILTQNFDGMILEAASFWPDGIGVVYSPMANFSFPALQAITAKLAAKIGYLYNHEFPFWYIDHELDDLARMIDRIAYADIAVDCHSLRPGKTLECRDLLFWTAYFDAARLYRRRKAMAIVGDDEFLTPKWQKEILRRNVPLIEHRSAWINNHGRAPGLEEMRGGSPPDARYLRILERAKPILQGRIAELQAFVQRAA